MGKPVGSVLDLRQAATPAAPAAGLTSLYSKSDGGIYLRTSTLAETKLVDNNDVGSLNNWIANASFETGVLTPHQVISPATASIATPGAASVNLHTGLKSCSVFYGSVIAGGTWVDVFGWHGLPTDLTRAMPVEVGNTVHGEFYVKQNSAAPQIAATLYLLDQTGATVSTQRGTAVTVSGAQQKVSIDYTIPAGTGIAYAMLVSSWSTLAAGGSVYHDDALLTVKVDDTLLTTAYAPASDPHLFRDVRAVQTANVSLASATVTVDGVTLIAGNRVLLTGQTAPAENGIYTVGTVAAGSAPLTRDTHFNTSALLANGGVIESTEGTTYGGMAWLTSFKATDTLGTTAMNWYRVTDASQTPLAVLLNNATTAQTFVVATETYVAGSPIIFPNTRMKAGTVYRCRMNLSKTAAGAAAASINVRVGTAGTTADSVVATASIAPTQTGAADVAVLVVEGIWIGVGAAATFRWSVMLVHNLAATGFVAAPGFMAVGTSSSHNTSTANNRIGISIAPGASAVYTVNYVETELFNLV